MGTNKDDLIVQCLTESQANFKNRKILQKDVQEFFCVRCRNDGCVRAGHGETAWAQRIGTQVDRFFNLDVTDPNLPQYRDLLNKEFADMTQHALRLIVSSQRGDWEVPNPSTFVAGPVIPEAPAPEYDPAEVEAAIRAMPPSPEDLLLTDGDYEDAPLGDDDYEDDGEDAPFGGHETFAVEKEPLYPDFVGNLTDSTPVPTPAPSIRAQLAKPPEQKPRTGNVQRRSGIMLDGGEPLSPEPAVDPWAVPEHLAPGGQKINVGGSFTFGGPDKKDGK